MAYTKQNFVDGQTLKAEHLNKIEDGIAAAETNAVPTSRTVNGKALSSNITLSASDVGADRSGTASSAVSTHNSNTSAHADIREQISQLSSEKVNKTSITLGIHTDGLVYVFVDGLPVGVGIDLIAAGDIIGYIDENNNVILSGNLTDGTYSIKYEMEDGSTVDIGDLVLDTNVYYSVTRNLTNCSISNSATQVIEGESYSATITANDGYELKSVTVTMGGAAVTVTNGVINIANVTGNIVITAVAEEIQTGPTNFADPTSADWISGARLSGGKINSYTVDKTGGAVTNFINIQVGDIVKVEGFDFTDSINRCGLGKADKSTLILVASNFAQQSTSYFKDCVYDANSLTFTVPQDYSPELARFSGMLTGTAADVKITITRNGTVL